MMSSQDGEPWTVCDLAKMCVPFTQANAALDAVGGDGIGDGLSQLRFDDGLGDGVGDGTEDRSGAPTEQTELPPWACS